MEIENLDENAAWHKVFTSGSEALKSKLKKVHAKNPKFQAFLKSGGYEGEQKSAAQAKKDVAVINKAKAKAAEPKKVDRIELIRRAVEKRNARNNRETATAYASMPSAHSRSQAAGHAADLKRDLQSKYSKQFAESHEPMKPYVKRAQQKFDAERRAQELEDRAKKRQAGTSYGLYLAAAKKAKLKEGRMKDIATDREETSRLKAQEVLGGPVVAKSTLPAGKRPAGQRRARSLARAALKNLLVKRKGK